MKDFVSYVIVRKLVNWVLNYKTPTDWSNGACRIEGDMIKNVIQHYQNPMKQETCRHPNKKKKIYSLIHVFHLLVG